MAGGNYGSHTDVSDVTEEETSMLASAGNFLWENLIWDSEAPLWMNVGGLALTVGGVALALPSGGLSLAASTAARAGLGAVARQVVTKEGAKFAGKIAAEEVGAAVVGATVVVPGLRAVKEAITPDAGPTQAIEYDAMGNAIGTGDVIESSEMEAGLAELSKLSNPTPKTDTADSSYTAPDPKTPDDSNVSSVSKAFTNTFNMVAGMLGSFLPERGVGLAAGLVAAFVVATNGDGDDQTSKMQELSETASLFMSAAFGEERPNTTESPSYALEAPKYNSAPIARHG